MLIILLCSGGREAAVSMQKWLMTRASEHVTLHEVWQACELDGVTWGPKKDCGVRGR